MSNVSTAYRTCIYRGMDSAEECDDGLFGLCMDLAAKGESRIPVAFLSSRHSYHGFEKAFREYCGKHGVPEQDVENAPVYAGNAFKSQWFPQFDRTIRGLVKDYGVKLIILDCCVKDTGEFSELAAELGISMIALGIKDRE